MFKTVNILSVLLTVALRAVLPQAKLKYQHLTEILMLYYHQTLGETLYLKKPSAVSAFKSLQLFLEIQQARINMFTAYRPNNQAMGRMDEYLSHCGDGM